MKHLLRLHQHNINAYDSNARNVVVHSKLNRYSSFNNNARFSIKYVHSGVEHYRINNKRYDVSAREFLLVNEHSELAVEFDHQNEAEGFCFFVEEQYVKQALSMYQKGQDWLLTNPNHNATDHHFLEMKYRADDNSFGQYLATIVSHIKSPAYTEPSEDFFLDFTHQLLGHQHGLIAKMERINAIKRSTKEELFKRTQLAKVYIDDHTEKKVPIKTLAQISGLSEVQLHRCFKQLFHQTPHQYQTGQRMNQSLALIQSKAYSLTEISLLCGFVDLPTFSKAFKKHFGISPSAISSFDSF